VLYSRIPTLYHILTCWNLLPFFPKEGIHSCHHVACPRTELWFIFEFASSIFAVPRCVGITVPISWDSVIKSKSGGVRSADYGGHSRCEVGRSPDVLAVMPCLVHVVCKATHLAGSRDSVLNFRRRDDCMRMSWERSPFTVSSKNIGPILRTQPGDTHHAPHLAGCIGVSL
jgi:hypothetical protein